MNQLGIAALWCVAQVTVIALVAGSLYLLLRRRAPAAGSAVAAAALAMVGLLSAMALSPWPCWWETATPTAVTTPSQSSPTSAADDPSATDASLSSDTNASERQSGAPTEADLPLAASFWNALLVEMSHAPTAPARETIAWSWQAVAGLLLLIGAAAGTLYLLAALWAVRRILRRSEPIRDAALWEEVASLRRSLGCRPAVDLRASDAVFTAAAARWRRPVVLLSPKWAAWTRPQRRAVLAHELAHVARGDYLTSLLAQLAVALHFYHPLVHWLTGRLRLEQELAADALAANSAGGRQAYLHSLAEMALRQDEHLLGWPARCFLPTRGTLIRRIEMLRDDKRLSTGRSFMLRALAMGALIVSALAVAGLRGPSGHSPAAAAEQNDDNIAAPGEPFDLTYTGDDGSLVIAFKPAAILQRREFASLRTLFSEPGNEFEQLLGVSLADVEQVIIASPRSTRDSRGLGDQRIFIRTTRPHRWTRWLADEVVLAELPQRTYHGKTYRQLDAFGAGPAIYQPDERTLVYDRVENIKRYIDGRSARKSLLKGDAWRQVTGDSFAIVLGGDWLRRQLDIDGVNPGVRTPQHQLRTSLAPLAPFWEEANTIALGVTADDNLRIRALAYCDDEKGAQRVEETARAAITLGRNWVEELRKGIDLKRLPPSRQPFEPALNLYFEVALELLAEVKVTRPGKVVSVEATAAVDADFLAPLALMVDNARAAAYQTLSRNNLKQIGLAMHNYHDVYKHFPPAVVIGPDGKTPHSWRVELLPFLNESKLYDQYRLTEPWDSPHNRTLIAKMPAVFRHPRSGGDSTDSSYYALVGPGTAFSPPEGARMHDFRDGTSNSLLIVEAKRDIPWTRPDDIPYDPKQPLPALGGFDRAGYNAALADGSVRMFTNAIDEKLLRAMISIGGGEVITWPAPPARGVKRVYPDVAPPAGGEIRLRQR